MSPVSLESEKNVLIPGNKPGKRSLYSKITEDGWAIWIGGLLIAVVLLIAFSKTDFKFASPVYQWSDTHDLVTKFLAAKNILIIAGIGVVFAILSSIAVTLSGGNSAKYIGGFIIVYVLA